jgi:GT2 family glycosyltransferase
MKIINNKCVEEEQNNDIILSIIIPVYNNVNYTKSILNDLLKLPSNHEIIVVDGASEDNTCEVVNELISTKLKDSPSLVYIGCPSNGGFASNCNKGNKHAKGKNIMFLNNDVRVQSNWNDWTQPIIDYCKNGFLFCPTGGLLDDDFNFVKNIDHLLDTPFFYLSGWCLTASKETFNKLIPNHYCNDKTNKIEEGKAYGPFSEQFGKAYFEDVDLSWRARELQIDFMVKPIPLYHFGHMTAKKMNMNKLYLSAKEIFTKQWKKINEKNI